MIWNKKIITIPKVYIKAIVGLIFLTLYSCQNQEFEDTTLEFSQLPDQVKRKFDHIFKSKVTNDTFIIFKCVDPKLDCDHQIESILSFNSKIVLRTEENSISIPFSQTAVRIFVYYDNRIYYIKRSGFSRLEGGKLDEFLEYKNQIYSVFNVD